VVLNEHDEHVLANNGWEVECESPLEIRHVDGNFARGALTVAAVLAYLEVEEREGLQTVRELDVRGSGSEADIEPPIGATAHAHEDNGRWYLDIQDLQGVLHQWLGRLLPYSGERRMLSKVIECVDAFRVNCRKRAAQS